MNQDENQIIKSTTEGMIKGILNSEVVMNLLNPTFSQIGELGGAISNSIKQKILNVLSIKFNKKEEKFIKPNFQIFANTIDCLKHTFYQEQLRDVVLDILTKACHEDYHHDIHPSYLQIVKELTAPEIDLIKALYDKTIGITALEIFWNEKETGKKMISSNYCDVEMLVPLTSANEYISLYLDNLTRLSILERRADLSTSDKKILNNLLDKFKAEYPHAEEITQKELVYYFTGYGNSFCRTIFDDIE